MVAIWSNGMRAILPSFFVLILATACTTLPDTRMEPLPGPTQQRVYQNGIPVLYSQKNTIVALRPRSATYASTALPPLVIAIYNGTHEPIDVSPDDIEVRLDGKLVHVRTYDEIYAQIRRKRTEMLVAAAVQGMNAEQATATRVSGTFYSPGSGHGSFTGTSVNQAAANRYRQELFANVENEVAVAMHQLENTCFRRHTIFPGQFHGGYIYLASPKIPRRPVDLTVIVHVGPDTHEFHLRQVPFHKPLEPGQLFNP